MSAVATQTTPIASSGSAAGTAPGATFALVVLGLLLLL